MDKYLAHLILHLEKYGNVYFPCNKQKKFGESAILNALKDMGYVCDIRHFPDAAVLDKDPVTKNRKNKKLDAVITLRKETPECYY